jgi:hypothetical protein
MSAWTYRSLDGKAAQKIVPPCPRIPVSFAAPLLSQKAMSSIFYAQVLKRLTE